MSVDFAILEHVSLTDCEAHAERAIQHAVPARGSGARPIHRRHHHADLSDVHVRPGRAGQAQGLRVRADAEPDARGARAERRGHRRRSRGVRPCLQRPIETGAHLVVHSTTKYLNGHSDSIGGVIVAVRPDDIAWLRFIQNAEGAILSPFDSWLVLRGTKTLPLRMAAHNANGLALAQFLEPHPKVRHVYYPGL